jgi:predicted polyphosphate/ATP-dependent NAD kinase
VRRIGLDRLTVVATPAKLKRTPFLRFDTGNEALDEALAAPGYIAVVTGYRRHRMTPICS